ncbi:MAG: ankyrin repeat domain-containing protein [Chloroflexota bacterium]|nr:ankyrin repeat domain-containing protein [Chloroflexota bacterium]
MDELFAAIKGGDQTTVERIVAADPAMAGAVDADGVSALLTALYHGNTTAADALRATGMDLTVFEAAAVGDLRRIRELVDGDPSLVQAYAADGFHALGLAAFFHHPEVVRFLIQAGADVSAPSRNPMRVTALHSAVADEGDSESALALVVAGADPNAKQRHGWTPLHAAAQTGDRAVIAALLAAGADPTLTHDAGRRAADLAREAGHTELAALLEHAPAASG